MNGELSFFELGVDDADRARDFYGGLFGWKFVAEGKGASIETPNVPGGLHCDDAGASPYLFFRTDDLNAACARARELGGEVGENLSGDDPDTVARFGRFVLCKDDQRVQLRPPPALALARPAG